MNLFTFLAQTELFRSADQGASFPSVDHHSWFYPMLTRVFWFGIVGGVFRAIFSGRKKDAEPARTSAAPPSAPKPPVAHPRTDHPSTAELLDATAPSQLITLVGRTSSGKSSLGNALLGQEAFAVGVEHGTTCQTHAVASRGNYQLQDTPGLLDDEHYSAAVFDAARASALVIFLTTGQLYRQELDFLRELCTAQAAWNRTRRTGPRRDTLVFLNAADLKERTMPSGERAAEIAALKAQVAPWLPPEAVLSGAAAPLDGSPPWIASLSGYLARFCQESTALATA